MAVFYTDVDGLLERNNWFERALLFLHFRTSSGVIACLVLPGVALPVATGVMVTAVAGMSWPLQGPFFYDLALIIWAKGVAVPSELTTPTRQKSDSWLASSAPALQNPTAPFDVALHFPRSRAARVWIDTSACLVPSRENMLEQGKVTSWNAFCAWKSGGHAMLSALGNTQAVVFGSLALVV